MLCYCLTADSHIRQHQVLFILVGKRSQGLFAFVPRRKDWFKSEMHNYTYCLRFRPWEVGQEIFLGQQEFTICVLLQSSCKIGRFQSARFLHANGMSEPSCGHQARWAGQSHAAKAIKQSQALGIISLQWCIPCTSQNTKWSLKVYLKCLSHFPEFPRSSSDFLLCKKTWDNHQKRMNPIQWYVGPLCQSRSCGTKCCLSPSPQLPVSKTAVSRDMSNFL